MPVTNWTVPDSSPWITYTGVWGDSDINTAKYNNGTFHFTDAANAAASLTFNGTGVSLYGAFRNNHGPYIVSLDGTNTTNNGLVATGDGVYNQTLFSQTGLTSGTHTVQLINVVPLNYTDIDWAIIEVGDGNPNTASSDFWMDDTHPNVTYDSTWTVGGGSQISEYYNSSFHITGSQRGSATIQFSGHQIALYGAASNTYGTYTVSLDGVSSPTYNANEKTFRSQQLLYFASNLKNGSHSVVITSSQAEVSLDFDYAIATTYWTVGPASTTSPGSSQPTPTHASSSSTPVGAIVGGVVGGVVMIGVIAFLLFLIYRQRKKNRGDAIFSHKGQDALGHELAPGVSVAAMASYGGARGPSPPRTYSNGLGANPNSQQNYSASIASGTTAAAVPGMPGHQYASRMQQPYGNAAQATAGEPLLGHGHEHEIDMPPPNYDHVFAQPGSSGGGSQAGGSTFGGGSTQFGGSSAGGTLPIPPDPQNAQIYRQLREKGVVIPPDGQTRVTRASDL